jgi:hypothetical protein
MEQTLTPTLALERPDRATPEPVACTAETAACTCPDSCERDHANE